MTVSKVVDRLYFGDWQEARDTSMPDLAKVTVAKESPFMGDYYFPLVDAEDRDNAEILWQAVQKVDDLMRDGKTVLVHCTSGLSRSCAVVMGYLAAKRGYTIDGAFDLVRKARPGVMPEQSLLKVLRSET